MIIVAKDASTDNVETFRKHIDNNEIKFQLKSSAKKLRRMIKIHFKLKDIRNKLDHGGQGDIEGIISIDEADIRNIISSNEDDIRNIISSYHENPNSYIDVLAGQYIKLINEVTETMNSQQPSEQLCIEVKRDIERENIKKQVSAYAAQLQKDNTLNRTLVGITDPVLKELDKLLLAMSNKNTNEKRKKIADKPEHNTAKELLLKMFDALNKQEYSSRDDYLLNYCFKDGTSNDSTKKFWRKIGDELGARVNKDILIDFIQSSNGQGGTRQVSASEPNISAAGGISHPATQEQLTNFVERFNSRNQLNRQNRRRDGR